MKDVRPWTTQEVNVLKNLYGRMSVDAIAEELDRSVWSVYGQIRQLNLKGDKAGMTWTKYEDNALKMMSKRGVSIDEMARALQRSESAVQKRLVRILHD